MCFFKSIMGCNQTIIGNVNSILIGVLSSIIATLIWWVLTLLFSFQARKRIGYYISCFRVDIAAFEKHLEYKDYDLATQQSHRIIDTIGRIYYSIKPFTYSPKKRKLINLLLLNLHLRLSDYQTAYAGYDIKAEKEACCEEMKKKWFPEIKGIDTFSIGNYSVEILSAMNNGKKPVINTLDNWRRFQEIDPTLLKNQLDWLIDAQSFKAAYSKEVSKSYCFTDDLLSKEEYTKLINKL